MTIKMIEKEMKRLANKEKAKILAGFFKTEKGQYGAGDKFLGITVPQQRVVAKKYYQSADLKGIQKLLNSPYHEFRLLGFIILTLKYPRADDVEQKQIYNFYLKNAKRANSWDLVDLSAANIVGTYLLNRHCRMSFPPPICHPRECGDPFKGKFQWESSRDGIIDSRWSLYSRSGCGNDNRILYKLARSKNLWERRIAIISTAAFIRAGQFSDTIKIAEILLNDSHDLIHKAVGWMLREIGKQNLTVLENFLKKYYMSPRDRNHRVLNPHISSSARKCKNSVFPLHSPAFAYNKISRTTLRYAIEKFPETKRKKYLKMAV